VELDALDASHSERQERPLVLPAAELPLDGGAAAIELAPPVGVAGYERVDAARLDPP
jgi:hypothetical protein